MLHVRTLVMACLLGALGCETPVAPPDAALQAECELLRETPLGSVCSLPNYSCIPPGGCARSCVGGEVADFCQSGGER